MPSSNLKNFWDFDVIAGQNSPFPIDFARHPQTLTHKQTYRQDRLQYTAPQLARSVITVKGRQIMIDDSKYTVISVLHDIDHILREFSEGVLQ